MPRVFANNIHLNYVEQGCGAPPLLLLLAAMDALGVERADLLGLSLGGAVAMRIAASHPARVRALVLVDTWAYPHPEFVAMLRARLVLLEKGDMPAYAEAAIPQVYSEAYVRANPAAIDAYRARVAQAAPASRAAAVNACIEHDMRGDLGHITARTLVVVGGEDGLTPPRHSHFPHLEAPTHFLNRLKRFLGESG